MRLSVTITTIFAALTVLALPVAQTESSGISLAARYDEPFGGSLYNRALTAAQKEAKAAKGKAAKDAGLKAAAGKTPEQIKKDRKDGKDKKKADKAVKAEKAKAKPGYKSHELKTKDKAKVTFSEGAAKRLDAMGLHGKDRKAAKKYHTNVMKSEMKKNGAAKGHVVATAHDGGTVKTEKNHITAGFQDASGRNMPSKWIDKKTGEEKTGEKDLHHVYTNAEKGKKAPKAWTNAVNAGKDAKAAEASAKVEAEKKRKEDLAAKRKAEGLAKAAAKKASTPSG